MTIIRSPLGNIYFLLSTISISRTSISEVRSFRQPLMDSIEKPKTYGFDVFSGEKAEPFNLPFCFRGRLSSIRLAAVNKNSVWGDDFLFWAFLRLYGILPQFRGRCWQSGPIHIGDIPASNLRDDMDSWQAMREDWIVKEHLSRIGRKSHPMAKKLVLIFSSFLFQWEWSGFRGKWVVYQHSFGYIIIQYPAIVPHTSQSFNSTITSI